MATRYTPDDREAALLLYQANHLEVIGGVNHASEFYFWQNARSLTAIPTGDARDTEIVAAAAALGVTVNEDSPWKREQQFWAGYKDKPPTAKP